MYVRILQTNEDIQNISPSGQAVLGEECDELTHMCMLVISTETACHAHVLFRGGRVQISEDQNLMPK